MSIQRERGRGSKPSRRAWAWLVAGICAAVPGCDALTNDPAPTEAKEPIAKVSMESAEAAPAPTPVSVLVGVLEHGIVAPPEGGSTYRVDAYVAALMVEHLQRTPSPFMAWRSDQPDPARPSVGYRVGPLPEGSPFGRLGLREGDIVHEVNGVSTAEAGWSDQALRRGENQVTVTVFRDDVSMTLAYRLMGGMAWQALLDPTRAGEEAPLEDDGGAGAGNGGLAMADDPPVVDEPVRGSGGGGGSGSSSGVGSGGGSSSRPTSPTSPKRPSTSGGGSGGGGTSTGGGTSSGGGKQVARCSSESSCTIDKAYWNSMVSSPTKLQSQADVVPAIRNDVFSGYKLRTVKPGSAVAQLGFRSGDKVTHVNGKDLTNDAEAMQLYFGISSTKVFKVRYIRGSSTRTKTITVV